MLKHIFSVAKCAPEEPAEAIADIQVSGCFELDPAKPSLHESDARFRLLERTAELREVKESENIEKHLMRADRLSSLGALAAGIAYEIRDPLAAMNLFLDVLGDGRKFRPTAHALNIIEEMKRNIRKIDRIIKRVTAFSGQSGATTQRELEMGALVEDTVSLWRSRMAGSGVDVRLSLDEGLANILGDPVEIQQVVTNLIRNAVEAMEKGGVLSVTAQNGIFPLQENLPAVIIRVQDCGRGIAPENHSSVFNPFFTTKSTATGLGLTVSRRIVLRHGGIIAFESVPDEGTIFWVTLPAMQRAGMPQRSFHAESAPRRAVRHVPREAN